MSQMLFGIIFLSSKKSGTPLSNPSLHLPHHVGQVKLVNVHGKVHYVFKAKVHAVYSPSEGSFLSFHQDLSLCQRTNKHWDLLDWAAIEAKNKMTKHINK